MKKCSKCENEVPDNVSTCPSCGNKVISFPQHIHLRTSDPDALPKADLPLASSHQEKPSSTQYAFFEFTIRTWSLFVCLLLIGGSSLAIVYATAQTNGSQSRSRTSPTHTPPSLFSPTATPTPSPTATPTPSPTATPTPSPTPIQLLLSSPRETQSKTVATTGIVTTAPGVQATGTVQIFKHISSDISLAKGTVFTNNYGCTALGLEITLDSSVVVSGNESTYASVHVVHAGISGNVSNAQCVDQSDGHVFDYLLHIIAGYVSIEAINDGPFTGGIDPKTVSVVQQKDINATRDSLITSTTKTAENNILNQLKPNERVIGQPHCSSSTSSNHAVGVTATTVQVTVSTICTWSAIQYEGT